MDADAHQVPALSDATFNVNSESELFMVLFALGAGTLLGYVVAHQTAPMHIDLFNILINLDVSMSLSARVRGPSSFKKFSFLKSSWLKTNYLIKKQ